jgi:signal transduction histidine kinase
MDRRSFPSTDLLISDDDDVPRARRSRRDWVVDGTVFVVALALGIASVVSSVSHGLNAPLPAVDVILGIAMCVSLWWRRRWPFALALVSLPIGVVSSFAGAPGMILLYTVAAYRRWQLACVVAVGEVVLLPAQRAIHPQGDALAVYYLTSILGTVVVVVWGMYRRGRLQAQRERQRRAEAEEQLRVEQIRHAERSRIAREMHDVLAHRISLLSLQAGALELRPDASPEEIAGAVGVIRASAHQALDDLRTVIGVLRDGTDVTPPPEPPQPTLAALPDLLEESRAAGMQLAADVSVVDLAAVPDVVGRHALRIVQEALTNARKHAGSAPVDLRIDGARGRGLTIEVRNPAPVLTTGTTQIPGSGTGLVGLAERAALSGGTLEHGLDQHGDFRLRAWLPWP